MITPRKRLDCMILAAMTPESEYTVADMLEVFDDKTNQQVRGSFMRLTSMGAVETITRENGLPALYRLIPEKVGA